MRHAKKQESVTHTQEINVVNKMPWESSDFRVSKHNLSSNNMFKDLQKTMLKDIKVGIMTVSQ